MRGRRDDTEEIAPTTRPLTGPPGQWRLLLPALLGWAVAAVAIGTTGVAWGVACAVVLVSGVIGACAIAVGCASRHGRPVPHAVVWIGDRGARYGAVACAVLVVLSVRIVTMADARNDTDLSDAAERVEIVPMNVTLTSFPESSESAESDRFWARGEAQTTKGPVPVLLWLSDPPNAHWAPGSPVMVSGRLERLEPASTAGYAISVVTSAEQDATSLVDRLRARAGALAAELRQGLREAAAMFREGGGDSSSAPKKGPSDTLVLARASAESIASIVCPFNRFTARRVSLSETWLGEWQLVKLPSPTFSAISFGNLRKFSS